MLSEAEMREVKRVLIWMVHINTAYDTQKVKEVLPKPDDHGNKEEEASFHP
jgi:hypothetical protein